MSRYTEAMARAMFMKGWPTPAPYTDDKFFEACKTARPIDWKMAVSNATAALTALLAEMDAAELVAGVPKHPDRKMQTAGSGAIIKAANEASANIIEEYLHCNDVWKPMLAAAPPFPPESGE